METRKDGVQTHPQHRRVGHPQNQHTMKSPGAPQRRWVPWAPSALEMPAGSPSASSEQAGATKNAQAELALKSRKVRHPRNSYKPDRKNLRSPAKQSKPLAGRPELQRPTFRTERERWGSRKSNTQ